MCAVCVGNGNILGGLNLWFIILIWCKMGWLVCVCLRLYLRVIERWYSSEHSTSHENSDFAHPRSFLIHKERIIFMTQIFL